jgi:hypothetical protein
MDAYKVNLGANQWTLSAVRPDSAAEQAPTFICSRAAANQRLAFSLSQIYHRPRKFTEKPPESIEKHHVLRQRRQQVAASTRCSRDNIQSAVDTMPAETLIDINYSRYGIAAPSRYASSSLESTGRHRTGASGRDHGSAGPSGLCKPVVPVSASRHPLITDHDAPFPHKTPLPTVAIFTKRSKR